MPEALDGRLFGTCTMRGLSASTTGRSAGESTVIIGAMPPFSSAFRIWSRISWPGCRDASLGFPLEMRPALLYGVNMARTRHPKKEVEGALQEAESVGWMVASTRSGHRWGVMRCGAASKASECRVSIWSTPRNAGNHARQLRRFIARCPHQDG